MSERYIDKDLLGCFALIGILIYGCLTVFRITFFEPMTYYLFGRDTVAIVLTAGFFMPTILVYDVISE